MPLKHLGYKAVVVNIRYLCNECQATQITVSVAVSNRFPLEALDNYLMELRTFKNIK
jgi:thiamine-monophosphate kinase